MSELCCFALSMPTPIKTRSIESSAYVQSTAVQNENRSESKPIRVVLCEHEELVRVGVRSTINSTTDIQLVIELVSPERIAHAVTSYQPRVVLLDSQLIHSNRIIRELTEHAAVIVLTPSGGDVERVEVLHHGALGLLSKDVSGEDLMRAIRLVSNGSPALSSNVTRTILQTMLLTVDLNELSDKRTPKAPLTDRETHVLRLIARGRSTEQIGRELHVSTATIKAHVRGLLAKLDVRDRAQAVAEGYELGIIGGSRVINLNTKRLEAV